LDFFAGLLSVWLRGEGIAGEAADHGVSAFTVLFAVQVVLAIRKKA
jgi:hypothetical protein